MSIDINDRSYLSDIKFTEIKTLDNSLLQKYDVKLYGSDKDT